MHRQSVFARSVRLHLPLAAAAAIVAAGASVHADAPLYRVIDLGSVAPPEEDLDPVSYGTFGLNNRGWAVWYVIGDQGVTAWVYRPNEADEDDRIVPISDIVSGTPSVSAARDINDCGQVAGQVGSYLRWSGQAVVWDLQAQQMLSAPFMPDAQWSRGIAISNSVPAILVGETDQDEGVCDVEVGNGCTPPNPLDDIRRVTSFRSVVTTSIGQPDELERWGAPWQVGGDCDQGGLVADVAVTGSGDIAVGYSGIALDIICQGQGTCDSYWADDAVFWGGGLPPSSLSRPHVMKSSHARGISESGAIAGWGHQYSQSIYECRRQAYVWTNGPSNLPDVLGDFMPEGEDDDESWAEAVNAATPREAVGWNVNESEALLWVEAAPDWEVHVLADLVDSCSASLFDALTQAWDINDAGWIIAWGDADPGPALDAHGYLLIPRCQSDIVSVVEDPENPNQTITIECPGGEVNSDDMFKLLGQWGPCVGCLADFTGDDVVDSDDMFILLGEWGVCNGGITSYELGCGGAATGGGESTGGESLPEGAPMGAPLYEPEVVLSMYGFSTWDQCANWLATEASAQEIETFVQMMRMAIP